MPLNPTRFRAIRILPPALLLVVAGATAVGYFVEGRERFYDGDEPPYFEPVVAAFLVCMALSAGWIRPAGRRTVLGKVAEGGLWLSVASYTYGYATFALTRDWSNDFGSDNFWLFGFALPILALPITTASALLNREQTWKGWLACSVGWAWLAAQWVASLDYEIVLRQWMFPFLMLAVGGLLLLIAAWKRPAAVPS